MIPVPVLYFIGGAVAGSAVVAMFKFPKQFDLDVSFHTKEEGRQGMGPKPEPEEPAESLSGMVVLGSLEQQPERRLYLSR